MPYSEKAKCFINFFKKVIKSGFTDFTFVWSNLCVCIYESERVTEGWN